MSISDLEKRIKELLGGEKAAVNTDELWNSLESHLPEKNESDRKVIWPLWLPFLVLSVGILGYLFLLKDDFTHWNPNSNLSQNEFSPTIAQSVESPAKQETKILEKDNSDSNDSPIKNISQGQKEENIEVLNVSPNVKYQELNERSQEAISGSSSTRESDRNFSSFSYSPAQTNGRNVNLTEEAESTERRGLNSSSRSYLSPPLSLAEGSDTNQQSSNSNDSQTQVLQLEQGDKLRSNNTIRETSHDQYKIQLLESHEIQNLAFGYADLNYPALAEISPLRTRSKGHFILEAGGSILAGHGSLTLDNQDFADHFQNRNDAEKSLLSFSFDAKIGYQISPQFYIHSGLLISNYYKSSSADLNDIETIVVQDGLVQEIVGINGTQEVRGQVNGLRETSSTVRRINTYNFIHVPIGASYYRTFNRFAIRMAAEARIGVNNALSGFIHPNRMKEYDISTDNQKWFSRQTPHFVALAAGIRYPISNRMSIALDANYQYQLGNINNNTYGITENLSGIGLRTGIQIKI